MGKLSRWQLRRNLTETPEERAVRLAGPHKKGEGAKPTQSFQPTSRHAGSKKNFDHERRMKMAAEGRLPVKGNAYRTISGPRRNSWNHLKKKARTQGR